MNSNPFVKNTRRVIAAGIGTIVLGAGMALAPSSAYAVDEPSPTQIGAVQNTISAHFWAKAATVTGVTAGAHSVAWSGIDITGKVLLEQEKTRSKHIEIRDLRIPTEAEVAKYGTIVHSMKEGQAVLAKEVSAYDKLVSQQKLKIKKLKLRIKHADAEEHKLLKRKLRKAKKVLKKYQTSWQYKPLLVLSRGVCYLNSGRRNNLDLQPFRDCVDGDKLYVTMGWVPEVREAVIASIKHSDGTYEDACHNYGGFDIPEGTPEASLFVVVESLLGVRADVSAAYTETVTLTIGGELMCPDGTPVRDERTVTQTKSDFIRKYGVPVTSVDEAMRFGDEQVRLRREERVGTSVSVSDQLVQSIGAELNLTCPNNPPVVDLVQFGKHLYVNGVMRYKVVATDPEDGANIALDLSNITVSGKAEILVDADHPVFYDVEGVQKVMYFWVKAKPVAGDYTVYAKVTDSKGDIAEQSVTKPVMPDEF